jgi:hypothetical protein
MAAADTQRLGLARQAYESGRWWATRDDAWVVLAVVAWGWVRGVPGDLLAGTGVLLLVIAVGASWRGGARRRGLWLGYLTGLVPLLLPTLAGRSTTCSFLDHCIPVCTLLCPVAGLVAGGLLGWAIARREEERPIALAVGGSVMLLTGFLGCATAGVWGVVGLAAAGLLASLSTLLVLRTRTT